MYSISSSRMHSIDTNCVYIGLSPLQLMENAGAAIAREIISRFSNAKVLCVAGRGNNGGDAFVAARHLAINDNYDVTVLLLGNSSRIRTEESKHNFSLLEHSGVRVIREIVDSKELERYMEWEKADIIIDAVLGSGMKGIPREPQATAISLINGSSSYVLSVDSPSGYDPGAEDMMKSVHADMTITFHRMKRRLEMPGSYEYTGEVKVVPIGVCRDAEEYVGAGDVMNLAHRSHDAHKGNSGRILVIGGGAYYGAPALTAMAALRSGVDIVTLAVPQGVADTVASFSPNLIVIPLPCNRLNPYCLETLNDLIKAHDVVVVGPGIGRETETLDTVRRIIPLCSKVVIDADALYDLELPLKHKVDVILTPHSAEFLRLCSVKDLGSIEEKKKVVRYFSRDNAVTTILKGRVDIISDGENVRLNRTGNPGMTVGGTGDVLTGITGALFAVNNAIDAASCAAFISGDAGDIAFREKGSGLLATDIIERITDVMSVF